MGLSSLYSCCVCAHGGYSGLLYTGVSGLGEEHLCPAPSQLCQPPLLEALPVADQTQTLGEARRSSLTVTAVRQLNSSKSATGLMGFGPDPSSLNFFKILINRLYFF